MGTATCGCSGTDKQQISLEQEASTSYSWDIISKKQLPQKKQVTPTNSWNNIQYKTRAPILARDDNININDSIYSNKSFYEESHLQTPMTTLCPLGCYKFLIYVQNNFLGNQLVYGYIRSIEMLVFVPLMICDLVHQYCSVSSRNKLICVGIIVLDENMHMTEVKKSICHQFKNEIHTKHMDHIRLRHIWSRKQELLANAYCNDKNLKENCEMLCGKITDNIRICCQQLIEPERYTKHHLVLHCIKIYKSIKDDMWHIDTVCDKVFDIIFIHKRQYINVAPEYMIQHHAYHQFNDEWIDYYATNHRWRLAKPVHIKSGDILLLADESLRFKQNIDVWK